MPLPAPLARLQTLARSPALAAYGIKAATAVVSFVVTTLIARMAGAEVVGFYGLAVVTATILGLVSLHGLDIILLRDMSGDLRQGLTGAARGALGFAVRSVGVAMAVVTVLYLAAVASDRVALSMETDHASLLAAAIGIGSVAAFRLGLASLRALGQPVASQFSEGAASFVLALILTAMWATESDISAALAVVLFFGSQLVVAGVIALIIRRRTRDWAPATPTDSARMRKAGFPIMAIQTMQMLQDWLLFVLVGGAVSAVAVGALRVAMQVVMVISIVVSTGENYLGAKVAGDLRIGRPDLVWRRHRRATLAMAVLLGPLVLVCILMPTQLLGTAFGPEFVIAGPALAIMAAGQATKIATGPIGGLMAMSGHERWLLRFTIASLAILVGLAVWLVPLYGLVGAAIAQAVSVTCRNVAAYVTATKLIPKVAVVE